MHFMFDFFLLRLMGFVHFTLSHGFVCCFLLDFYGLECIQRQLTHELTTFKTMTGHDSRPLYDAKHDHL